jgi:hypothetical protein
LQQLHGNGFSTTWDPILMIGLGGIFAETIQEVRFLPAASNPLVIADEFMKLSAVKLLDAFRGETPRD